MTKKCKGPFYGKYRGVVVDNLDVDNLGRLLVSVPNLYQEFENWALPSLPFAGPLCGWYAIPPIGASVWVEFERGELSLPIWSGCFWNKGEAPLEAKGPEVVVFKAGLLTLTATWAGELSLTLGEPGAGTSVTMTPESMTLGIGEETQALLTPTTITIRTGPALIAMGEAAVTISLAESSAVVDEAGVNLNGAALTVLAL